MARLTKQNERKPPVKHYLLTWYGITDLRASLALDATDGPILSALKTGKYTDVVILAYTNPTKPSNKFTDELRGEWETMKAADLETRLRFPREKAQQLVDSLSNTQAGHAMFTNWLKAQLADKGIACDVQAIPCELKHLNDAQGIYAAATSALKLALEDTAEKTITTYVSPGTPVMAYTWALIARAHPQHSIGVIASSEPRNPPEAVDLPKDLLMPLVSAPQTTRPTEYDVIIHLLGRERMPIYFGMLQFRSPMHVFMTTREYESAAKVLSRCLPATSRTKTVTIRDPFTPADTRRAIEKQVVQLPPASRVAVNLTGGTKLMFTGALTACWERGLEPFYFEVKHHNVIFLRDGSTVPFVGAKSVEDFFAVNGFNVLTPGHWEDAPYRETRLNVTKELWTTKHTLGRLYQSDEFRRYKTPWGKTKNPPFHWNWGTSDAHLSNTGAATLVLNGKSIPIPKCDDYGQYLGGGWLEEYAFTLLRTIEAKGQIHDLRIGIEVGYSEKTPYTRESPSGEFDCAFTDGKRLWLVECKAGYVKQEHIQKLENNLKTYGGIAAKGILVSSFPIDSAQGKRISSSTSIRTVQAEDVRPEVIERIIAS